MKRTLLGALISVALFVFYVSLSQAIGIDRPEPAIGFAASATVITVFIYRRIAKRFNL
jgi:hypothetical protein